MRELSADCLLSHAGLAQVLNEVYKKVVAPLGPGIKPVNQEDLIERSSFAFLMQKNSSI